VPVKAIQRMRMQHSPLVIWPLLDAAMWRWGPMMLANCTARAHALDKSRMVPIAEYSRDCLKALRAQPGIACDERAQGTLQLFQTQKQLDGIAGDVAVLRLAELAAGRGVRSAGKRPSARSRRPAAPSRAWPRTPVC
jgi:D-amino-acid dehydrogenase